MASSECDFQVRRVELRVLPMQTRLPFRYGMVTLRALPHVFVVVELDVAGTTAVGVASDGLAPKWFVKNPHTTLEQDLLDMIAVIQNASRLSPLATPEPVSFFRYWQRMQREMGTWAQRHAHPPLLWNLGVSLMERAILDALCKILNQPAHQVIRAGLLQVDMSALQAGLGVLAPEEFLPEAPLESVQARHTVGLTDPIRTADIPEAERLQDGLPQSLEECISAYGLRLFKIKLSASLETDLARLREIQEVLTAQCATDYAVTLDGNENFNDIVSFRHFYEALRNEASLRPLLERVLWVEQPLHRARALDEAVGQQLAAWKDAPRMLVDESDGACGDAHTALSLGYLGVSHKNCKGIIKGLLNAALVRHHQHLQPGREFVLSGEDLANVGPVALQQDLAMQALLGVTHVERNGHHYFRGLSMYGETLNHEAVAHHGDLYELHADGFATLRLRNGEISLKSVNAAPFGCNILPDLSSLPTMKEWIMQGGMAEVV